VPSGLDAAVRRHPGLEPAASSLRALISAMHAVDVRLPEGVPNLDAARARLHGGIPALDGEPLLGGAGLRAGVAAMADRLRPEGGEVAAAVAGVAGALERAHTALDGDVVARAALAGDWESIMAAAPRLDVDEYALVTVLDYASRPALRAGAERVAEALHVEPWRRGTCPACGAPPLLAELRGKESERVLRCGRCATAWAFPRLACAACGERSHRRLGALHGEGEEEHRRADYCEACKSYVKAVAVLDPLTPAGLIEEDLATVALDLVAVERGYHR